MKCPRCKQRPKKKHANAKWCGPCAAELRNKPVGKLTTKQEATVRRLAGRIYAHELAAEIGTSVTNLKRWARDNQVSLNALSYPDEVIEKVCIYYSKHGKEKTQKRFPNVKVRSIVERYFKKLGLPSRQQRWTAMEIIELAKMGGLISPTRQAEFFSRPRAYAGSIKSAWSKKFGQSSVNVNGLSHWIAQNYVKRSCPYYRTSFYEKAAGNRLVALWVDVEKHLDPATPVHLQEAIRALANFQRWLHGRNAKRSIEKILEERS